MQSFRGFGVEYSRDLDKSLLPEDASRLSYVDLSIDMKR